MQLAIASISKHFSSKCTYRTILIIKILNNAHMHHYFISRQAFRYYNSTLYSY